MELKTDGNQTIPATSTSKIPDLDPTLVKAVAMQESLIGKTTTDVMQVNNKGDWNESKSSYGLTKGGATTAQQSIHAGIRVLASKGFKGGEYNPETKDRKFQGWDKAASNYNGGVPLNMGKIMQEV